MHASVSSPRLIPSVQQEAVAHFVAEGRGHGVVVSHAGTGKTATLAHAVASISPGASILCCAFNARARDILIERVPPNAHVRTLHQLGRDTMRSWSAYRRFQHDEEDAKGRDMATLALTHSKLDQAVRDAEAALAAHEPKTPEHDDARALYRAARDRLAEAVEVVTRGARLVKATLTTTRADLLALIRTHHLDADELTADELAGFIAGAVKAALDAWPRTDFDDEVWLPVHYGLGLRSFDFVFIDEAHDLSLAQIRLALSAVHAGGRVIAILDPAQAIYQWRGASSDPLGLFTRELGAQTYPLSVSFRCPRAVVEYVRSHVPDFEAHPDAPEGSVAHIDIAEMLTTIRPGDFLLSRTNAPLAQLGLELDTNGVPARVIGSADVARVLVNLVRRSRRTQVPELLVWLESFREKERARLADNPSALAFAEDKIDTVRNFTDGVTSTAQVITQIERFYAEQRAGRRSVLLATVHRTKGDEADNVFLLEESFFSKRGDPTEEANIHYVACTRARRNLFIVTGLRRRG